MRIHHFNDYDAYLRLQRRGSSRKRGPGSGASALEFGRIVEYLRQHGATIDKAICHGARCGTEVRRLKEAFPTAEVIGTDVFAKNPELVMEWDFHETKPEWVGAFDLVYSNALDHSPRPKNCLETWFGQLKPTGFLFVQWTFLHTLEKYKMLPCPHGDCFGASLHEYVMLLNTVGIMRDLLWCPVKRGKVICVASPRS